ncbi:MAG: cytochrome c class [Sphingomonadales bacterium]|nr:cytochrome c class [Sphingomonadales bacterium]
MPSSLRFVLILLGLGALSAPVAVYVIYAQDRAQARITAEQITGGRVTEGKTLVARYGCGACHEIGSVAGLTGKVGPSLNGVASRAEIAGRLSNQPANMIFWIRFPQKVSPGNGMPNQGIGDGDARDIAAYLYTLR